MPNGTRPPRSVNLDATQATDVLGLGADTDELEVIRRLLAALGAQQPGQLGGGLLGLQPAAPIPQQPGLFQPFTVPTAVAGAPPGVQSFAPSGTIFQGGSPFRPDFTPQRINNALVAGNRILKAIQNRQRQQQKQTGQGATSGG